MVGGALACFTLCCIHFILQHCCIDPDRTYLASPSSAEEKANQDLDQEDFWRDFGAKDSKKDQKGDWSHTTPSYLESFRSTKLSASSDRDVVALQCMQRSKFESDRKLPKMSPALVKMLDTQTEEVKIEKHKEQGQEGNFTAHEASRGEWCPERFSRAGPMDSEHTSKSVARSQKSGECLAGGQQSWDAPTACASTASQAGDSSATRSSFVDIGGSQVVGQPSRATSIGYDNVRGDVGQTERTGTEGKGLRSPEESDTRSYQQTSQNPRQVSSSTAKDQNHGSRVGQVCGCDTGEDPAPCYPVSTSQGRALSAVPREVAGAAELESGDQLGLTIHGASSAGRPATCARSCIGGRPICHLAGSAPRGTERLDPGGGDADGHNRDSRCAFQRLRQGTGAREASHGEGQDIPSLSIPKSSCPYALESQERAQRAQGVQGQVSMNGLSSQHEFEGVCSMLDFDHHFAQTFAWIPHETNRIVELHADFEVPQASNMHSPQAVVQAQPSRKAVRFADTVEIIAFF